MRDFSWTYFAMTGDVDAFLLYKEVDQLRDIAGTAGAAAEANEESGASEQATAF